MIQRVLIMDDQHERLRAPLAAAFPDVEFIGTADAEAALPWCGQADGLIAIGPFITRAMIDAAPRVRWIQSLTTGMESLVALTADRPDIALTSARGVAAPAVAEFVLLSLLALRRAYPRIIEDQRAGRWERTRGSVLDGTTVAIVGVGAIGEALAHRCSAMGMHVIGVSDGRASAPGFDRIVRRDALASAAAAADALVVAVPLAAETHHLIDAMVIAAMPAHAILVNVARGDVVDQPTLLAALRAGRIAGAALDVTSPEPLPSDHPFWAMPNVIVSPHTAGDIGDLCERAVPLIEHNLRAVLAGQVETMRNVVRLANVERARS
jgi:phosphoglycerate dehydrogenase-like enzyme